MPQQCFKGKNESQKIYEYLQVTSEIGKNVSLLSCILQKWQKKPKTNRNYLHNE